MEHWWGGRRACGRREQIRQRERIVRKGGEMDIKEKR